jgi:hypothetical protein
MAFTIHSLRVFIRECVRPGTQTTRGHPTETLRRNLIPVFSFDTRRVMALVRLLCLMYIPRYRDLLARVSNSSESAGIHVPLCDLCNPQLAGVPRAIVALAYTIYIVVHMLAGHTTIAQPHAV